MTNEVQCRGPLKRLRLRSRNWERKPQFLVRIWKQRGLPRWQNSRKFWLTSKRKFSRKMRNLAN
jgi:hypothetical protein